MRLCNKYGISSTVVYLGYLLVSVNAASISERNLQGVPGAANGTVTAAPGLPIVTLQVAPVPAPVVAPFVTVVAAAKAPEVAPVAISITKASVTAKAPTKAPVTVAGATKPLTKASVNATVATKAPATTKSLATVATKGKIAALVLQENTTETAPVNTTLTTTVASSTPLITPKALDTVATPPVVPVNSFSTKAVGDPSTRFGFNSDETATSLTTKDHVEKAVTSSATSSNMTIDWSHKTPEEVANLARFELDQIMHDKYVPLVIVAMGMVMFATILFVVQQMVENPYGAFAKVCRCLVGVVRILCWPIRLVCCCRTDCGPPRRDTQPGGTHQRLATSDRDDLELA